MTFQEWAKSHGIQPRSHDWSIAKAAWEAAIKAVIELGNKQATLKSAKIRLDKDNQL